MRCMRYYVKTHSNPTPQHNHHAQHAINVEVINLAVRVPLLGIFVGLGLGLELPRTNPQDEKANGQDAVWTRGCSANKKN